MIEKKFDIHFNEPFQSGKELDYLKEALDNNWLSTEGEQIHLFKRQLTRFFGTPNITLTNSGTSALHLALMVSGVEKDDFVICQSFSFVASANPILYQGAIPVFVDSEERSWNMDPHFLIEAIKYCLTKGKKPKAVIVVHVYGFAANLGEIVKICNEYELPIIEDAAEALGSTFFDEKLGNFGNSSVISFNGNKIVTSTSGGALIVRDEKHLGLANKLANQSKDEQFPYDHTGLGYNYRMSNICAAVGRAQMENLAERIERKKDIYSWYYSALSKTDCVRFQVELENSVSNRWVTAILFKSEIAIKNIIEKLYKNKIECRNLWKPIHLLPQFIPYPCFGSNVCIDLHNRGLALPSGLGLTKYDVNRITELIIEEI